jgi:DNA invertase Pin-like site-specific DNA recombinase
MTDDQLMFTTFDDPLAFDSDQDRDLVARMNETGDPQELASLASMARERRRARRREARREARAQHSHGRRSPLLRVLSFRP